MSNVRFGLIGYGAWGQHHANAIAKTQGAELTTIAARSEQTCAKARADHPSANVYQDYRELLNKEELDVIDVVLPSDLHHEVGLAALQANRHLLMEKPMALTVQQCDELNQLASKRDRILAVGFELRLSSLWGKVHQMIQEGAIGDPLYLLIELWRRPYRQGSEGWRYSLDRVGNWVLEEPIHFFDLARWYLGAAGEPTRVYARANSRQKDNPWLKDNFTAVLNFGNGPYAVITQTLCAFEHHQTAKITGTDGALWASWSGAMDRTRHPTFSLKHLRGETVEEIPIERSAGELFELEDQIAMMVSAVREGTPVAANGEDGRWAVLLCQAACQSEEASSALSIG